MGQKKEILQIGEIYTVPFRRFFFQKTTVVHILLTYVKQKNLHIEALNLIFKENPGCFHGNFLALPIDPKPFQVGRVVSTSLSSSTFGKGKI